MNRVISVVTAAYQPVPEYLNDAYQSLCAQELPEGWQWQWVVQEDGQTGEVARMLPADPRISPGSARRSGEAATRTLCLSRATGELIKVLDSDDQLTPGTLTREISIMTTNSDIGWTTCRVLDLLADGSTVGFDADPPEGRIGPGQVLEHWRSHNYRAQVHPVTLCMRRELLYALGGWMALPASGDTGLLLAANAISAGYFIADVGLLYRKWPGQMTNQAAHTDQTEQPARMAIVEQRATALAALWGAAGNQTATRTH
jgi:glycosyltransferase involved in cell wall biosynthesis